MYNEAHQSLAECWQILDVIKRCCKNTTTDDCQDNNNFILQEERERERTGITRGRAARRGIMKERGVQVEVRVTGIKGTSKYISC